jgi:hypothetical protein
VWARIDSFGTRVYKRRHIDRRAMPLVGGNHMHIRRRMILTVTLLWASFTALGGTASSGATEKVRDLPESTAGNAAVARLAATTTYGASLVDPTPNLTPAVRGWAGAQFVTHQAGKVRYETAMLFWQNPRHEVDIISGPAMTMSPADTLARPLSRHFNFAPYQPPTSVKRWTVAGQRAMYFDATAPPPGEWTVIGANPPELRIEHDNAFRMAALTVRARTVVIVVHGPAADFKQFLPIAARLVASLRFPPG